MNPDDLLQDFYYSDAYISLYAQEEDEELFGFEYKEGREYFIAKSLKRPIRKVAGTDIEPLLFDLNSVYGYQGYRSNSEDPAFIGRALDKYTAYAIKHNVVAEFMFFHPFNDFPVRFHSFFDYIVADRNYVVVNLQENLFPNYRRKHRSAVRKAMRELLFKEGDDVEKLMHLYRWTMKKIGISVDKKFNMEFFRNLLSSKECKLFEVTNGHETLTMGIFIYSPPFMHYHVSANSELGYKLNAHKLLVHKALEFGYEEGCRYGILGIGRSASPNDSLYQFKKHFSRNEIQGYVAGKIFNNTEYDRLCRLHEEATRRKSDRFFKYRMPI